LGSIFALCTKCPLCGCTYTNPKVLLCFHTFCQCCLEKVQDHRDKISCPQCHADTPLGASGVNGLLCDFGVTGLIETAVAGTMDFQSTSCTSCKSRESSAVARCLTCANFLCPSCVMAHQVCANFVIGGCNVHPQGSIVSNWWLLKNFKI
jgi:tripartite motif-containing protein 2/3